MMLLAIMVLTSCGSNDSDKLTLFYNVSLSPDMAEMADLAISYKDGSGATVTDTVTGTYWEKKVAYKAHSDEFGLVGYEFIPKPESQLKKETYAPRAELSMFARETFFNKTYIVVDSVFDDTADQSESKPSKVIHSVKREKVADFIKLLNGSASEINNDEIKSMLQTAIMADERMKTNGK